MLFFCVLRKCVSVSVLPASSAITVDVALVVTIGVTVMLSLPVNNMDLVLVANVIVASGGVVSGTYMTSSHSFAANVMSVVPLPS